MPLLSIYKKAVGRAVYCTQVPRLTAKQNWLAKLGEENNRANFDDSACFFITSFLFRLGNRGNLS